MSDDVEREPREVTLEEMEEFLARSEGAVAEALMRLVAAERVRRGFGEVEYFYTEHWPHRWSSGPSVVTYNKNAPGYPSIGSLEEARELAAEGRVESWGDDRCETGFGMRWKYVPEREWAIMQKSEDGVSVEIVEWSRCYSQEKAERSLRGTSWAEERERWIVYRDGAGPWI